MGVFADSIRDSGRRALLATNDKVNQIAYELFTSVIKLTPSPSHPGKFAEGHLANQWYVEYGGFSDELSSATSPNGADSLARASAVRTGKAFLGKDGSVSLTNNLSYAYRAEALGWPEADGWAGVTGPYRMVGTSLQYVAAKYK